MDPRNDPRRGDRDRYWLHLLLFVLTLLSTVYAGGAMAGRAILYARSTEIVNLFGWSVTSAFLMDGLLYGGSLLAFLTVHEFGHYFAARIHSVRTSLPYYVPFPFNGIGTFGAVIRIREQVPSMRKLFDIGAAGPVAGFVVALGV
ncbi:MAG: site-2 protease family protein, partial [Rhodothermales bacterium]|nr:site-2 protease family protein [Rhodothermales bacterium]